MSEFNRDLHNLYGLAMKPILEKSVNKQFLTQKEYEENYGIITLITSYRNNIEKKLNQCTTTQSK